MQPQQYSLKDWQRLVIGDAPWVFLAEVILRALVVYLVLLFFMRLMGKRVAAQMSSSELSVILMLGAAIGLPIQVPDKGILPMVVILVVILALQRGILLWTFRSRTVEVIAYGDVEVLLKDGRLLPHTWRTALLSPPKIVASLRADGIEHLGQLRRIYLEASGDMSLIRFRQPRPGLLILPAADSVPPGRYREIAGVFACAVCGHIIPSPLPPSVDCTFCGSGRWAPAVLETPDPDA